MNNDLTIEEMARVLRVSPRTMCKWIDQGRIHSEGSRRVTRYHFHEFMKQNADCFRLEANMRRKRNKRASEAEQDFLVWSRHPEYVSNMVRSESVEGAAIEFARINRQFHWPAFLAVEPLKLGEPLWLVRMIYEPRIRVSQIRQIYPVRRG